MNSKAFIPINKYPLSNFTKRNLILFRVNHYLRKLEEFLITRLPLLACTFQYKNMLKNHETVVIIYIYTYIDIYIYIYIYKISL